MIIVSVVILKDNRILMVQEGKKHCYKQWNTPAGHLEYGENLIKSAIREVYEETGYRTRIIGLNGIYDYMSKLKNHCVRFNFIGEIIGGRLKFDGKEILDVKWFSIGELKKMGNNQLRTAKVIRKIIKDIGSGKIYPVDLIYDELVWVILNPQMGYPN